MEATKNNSSNIHLHHSSNENSKFKIQTSPTNSNINVHEKKIKVNGFMEDSQGKDIENVRKPSKKSIKP